ncbi:Carbon monoxide dehydrogenase subunit G (CoxG) [Pigmentiphaga humi]|uniref:Carbon monoxide dehydrogenase subunit G (CoxG) n=1 Tax=Pigmentiphaga humi TaxID=2478468 RepID=A0A3P4AWZ4_9BURK|nr:carbon monoxide dehydrogenase subunit G [Pigmentiphaga humi]VCU68262.1 Carbon monoxide dehydrogenase subunit G (CoxG) [Pigmentiphaga humi]
MQMEDEQRLPAAQDAVWAALNDPEVLRRALPGCAELVRTGEDGFDAVVEIKIGPMKVRFKAKVALSEIEAPSGYVISGEGVGGVAGFAQGSARIGLQPVSAGETLMRYQAEMNIGGKIAQLGARLIDSTARKYTEQFFANFRSILGPAPDAASGAAAAGISEGQGGRSPDL